MPYDNNGNWIDPSQYGGGAIMDPYQGGQSQSPGSNLPGAMGAGASLGGGIGAFAGSLVGNQLAQGDFNSQMQQYQNALQQYQNINSPTAQQLQVGFQKPGTVNLGQSQMGQVAVDPQTKLAQMQALQQMQRIGSQGWTPEEQAGLENAQRQQAALLRGETGAIEANQMARGMGGSGGDLVSQQMAAQGAADRARGAGLDVTAQGRARAFQAMQAAGGMAGDIRNQDFGEAAARANANDAVSRYNAQNQQGQMNLGANIGNQQSMWNSDAYQKAFGDQMGLAGGRAGAMYGLGGMYGQRANRTMGQWTGIGQGIGAGLGAAGGAAIMAG